MATNQVTFPPSVKKITRFASQKRSKRIIDILSTALLTIMSLAALFPFYWMLSNSFKTEFEAFQFPPTLYPQEFTWENYRSLTDDLPFALFFWNSTKISFLGVVGQLFTSSLAAFGFARLKFPGKDMLFLFVLGMMMVPGIVTIVPLYIIVFNLDWVNTYYPLILPSMLGSSFGTFLLRQYMLSLPIELEDAARIDGCNTFQIYYLIVLPLLKPALATLGLFVFMDLWNDFFGPLIFLDKLELFTVQLGAALARGQWHTDQGQIMAGAVMISIPVLLVFIFTQRYFVQGIALTGIKG
jgi:multiple sugar transport system permease protein